MRFKFFIILSCLALITSKVAADQSFDVGLVLPLTGPVADYGFAIQNSIELARKDRPELFTNIKFHIEDAQSDAAKAVTAYGKLLNENRIKVSATFGVAFCKALAPIAESKKVPLVGLCLDPTVATNRHYVLRFKNTTDEIMEVQAKYLQKKGLNRIALVKSEHPYFEELTQALQRNLLQGQTLSIIDELPPTETDLKPTILKLKSKRKDYDSVGAFLWVGQLSTFYRQLKDLTVELPTFGSDLFESPSEVNASRGLMDNIPFSGVEVKPDFIKRYRDTYHEEGQLAFGAPAYEFALLLGELFNNSDPQISAEEIMEKFSSVSERAGKAAGPYKFVNDQRAGKYFHFPIVMKVVRGNEFVVLP